MSEIIKDAVTYPTQNIKALVIYVVLGFLAGLVAVLTGISSITSGTINFQSGVVLGIIGLIVIIAIYLLMLGFSLDIIKFGISRSADAPGIDFARQVVNGLKYIVLTIVYMIIPIIIIVVLGAIFKHWVVVLIGIILAIIFLFVLTMAICRLAETDELGYALDIGGAIDDLKEIGIGNVILTVIVAAIVGFIIVFALSFVLGIILAIFNSNSLTSIVVPIVSSILDAWLLFYMNRAIGSMYSNKN